MSRTNLFCPAHFGDFTCSHVTPSFHWNHVSPPFLYCTNLFYAITLVDLSLEHLITTVFNRNSVRNSFIYRVSASSVFTPVLITISQQSSLLTIYLFNSCAVLVSSVRSDLSNFKTPFDTFPGHVVQCVFLALNLSTHDSHDRICVNALSLSVRT